MTSIVQQPRRPSFFLPLGYPVIYRSIVSESKKVSKSTSRSGFKQEYNMVVFTREPLGSGAVRELHEALRRSVRAYESFSKGRFYQQRGKRGYEYQSNAEIDELVSAGERDTPFWDVRFRKETYRGVDVDVEILATYNLRSRFKEGDSFSVQRDKWLAEVSRLPSPQF